MSSQWRIEMFGGLQASQGERVISRFKTQKTAGLLSYLAFHPQRVHSREMLIALFWPDAELEQGRPSLSVALSSLRQLLEPPGTPARSVLLTTNTEVRLNPAAFTTDVAEFEAALAEAGNAAESETMIAPLKRAVECYRGDLLPSHYEEWCLLERGRLQDLYIEALRSLVRQLVQKRQVLEALAYTERAISADPLREELHRDLMHLYARTGQDSTALQHYREFEARWQREMGAPLSATTRRLARQIAEHRQQEPEESAPRLRSVTAAAMLPISYTRYFGREEELARLLTLLSPHAPPAPQTPRLVTLTGPGGIGKTRLSLEAARQAADVWKNAIWFVPLETFTEAKPILEGIVEAMHLPRPGNADVLALLRDAFAPQPSLLILDNLEQIADEAVPVIRRLLLEFPTLHCLATSRRRLNMAEEQEFLLRPLPVTVDREADGHLSLEALSVNPAVCLFVDRARAANPDFQMTERNAEAIAALCERLEGLPLALELAAARAQALSPAQMLEQLRQGSNLLANRRKEAPERHRSLRAAFAWSYDLLPPDHQRFLAQLSVFRGGWTLEAADTVCRNQSGETFLTLDMLMDLQEASLILTEERDGRMRFRMLESLREYAEEHLATEASALRERHLAYFLAQAEETEPLLSGPEQAVWLPRLEAEHDNFSAALNVSIQISEKASAAKDSPPLLYDQGLRLTVALRRFWDAHGHYTEGYRFLSRLLACFVTQPMTKIRSAAFHTTGMMAYRMGDFAQAHFYYEQALAFYRKTNDSQGMADLLNNRGLLLSYRDPIGSQTAFEESLALHRATGNRLGEASVLSNLGLNAANQKMFEESREYYAISLPLLRECGEQRGLIRALRGLGYIANLQEDYPTAELFFQEAQTLAETLGDRSNLGWAVLGVATARKGQKDAATAALLFETALTILREIGEQEGVVGALYGWGGLEQDLGNCAEAQTRYREALKLAIKVGLDRQITQLQNDLLRLSKETPALSHANGSVL